MEFSVRQASILVNAHRKETSHLVTGIQEKIPYCTPGTSAGKQKKVCSTCHPQFRSENTPATIEADQNFWPFNNWRLTVIQPVSLTTSTASRNCPNPLQQICPTLTVNRKKINWLTIYSKRVSKSTINSQKKTIP